MLRDCQALLHDFSLQAQYPDRWQWRPDSDRGYSVRGAYQLLTSQQHIVLHVAVDLIWHKQVSLKVSIFAWRLLRDSLPTKANLVARGIISLDALLCVSGCGEIESAQHLFLCCSFFGSLWPLHYKKFTIYPRKLLVTDFKTVGIGFI
jgi:hypothetical protein